MVPQLFTRTDPTKAILKLGNTPPAADQWFGRDTQGYDVFARTIYGARASILVGVLASLATSVIGVIIGTLAAFYGGISDTLIMRITDIFFAIPFLLGGILFMSTFPNTVNSHYFVIVGKVVLALSILGWPSIARLMRGSVLQVQAERLHHGGPGSRCRPVADHPVAHPSQRDGPGHRRRRRSTSVRTSRPRRRCPSSGIGLRRTGDLLGRRRSRTRLNWIRVAPWSLLFPRPVPQPGRPGVHHAR